MQITAKEVGQSITDFVEIGGAYFVDATTGIIKQTGNGDPQLIDTGNGELKPLRIFNENMEVGDFILFNPYVETLGLSAENEWFLNSVQTMLGMSIKGIMSEIIEGSLSTEDSDKYDTLDYITPVISDIDKKTQKEFKTLGSAMNFIDIGYNKKTQVASLRCAILDPDFIDAHSGVRKKTWNVFHSMIHKLLGSDLSVYTHQGTIISMLRCDAFLHVASRIITKINKPVKLFLDSDLHCRKISNHVKNLREYSELKIGFAITHAKGKTKKQEKKPQPTSSWKTSQFIGDNRYVTGGDYAGISRVSDGDRIIGASNNKMLSTVGNQQTDFGYLYNQPTNTQPVSKPSAGFTKYDASQLPGTFYVWA